MMASFMSYFGARRDPKQSARDAIVTLRQQLQMIEKKEEHLQKKIEEELKKAKANAVSNKAVATAALKRKKASEAELDRLAGTRLQLEMQVNTLESANLNAETMAAMKKGADALKVIHGNMTIDKVDAIMNQVNDQRALADEVADVISNPTYSGLEIDDDELKAELDELEQDELNERLAGAEPVPLQQPPQFNRQATVEEDDEAQELEKLKASLAM
ncbi:Snf7-domain-containing protein [Dendrothele bispora CBS 962.96]|uniref:Vacuolar-sorting protein SNF7 n=1 Tax=Dendrothele bispora (strain CBS 962.96) TaxID=1314807 RepID=A0A4S8MZL9_DENBC|nr:Snf7-domain-containing protein [Dendrothele bispora CBS 962.96]